MMGLSGMIYNGDTYYYEKNTLGDIIGIRNSAGTQVATYSYDAWGNIISKSGTMADINPFRYRGYYYDNETGFYYLQTRYYDPSIRMFINADNYELTSTLAQTIGQLNMYAYANNNPIMFTDESGMFLISTAVLIGAIIGAVAGATVGGIIAYNIAEQNGATGWELVGWTAMGVVGGGLIGAGVGAAAGYGIGYWAGGTYANGLVAKSVSGGVKAVLSQTNKVHHILDNVGHNLSGYTKKSLASLMKNTLSKGIIGTYKSVQSAYWYAMNSEVTFVIINGVIKISDMWIR